VLKHVVLMMLVEHLKKKPAPFFYLDTHAGGGTYDLSLGESQRSGEYKNGIGRLLEFPEAALAPELADYVRLVKACAGAGRSAITAYPGSPTIVGRMRRRTDRLVLAETAEGSGRIACGGRPSAARLCDRRRRVRGSQGAPATARRPRPGAHRPALRIRSSSSTRCSQPRSRARTLAYRHVLRLVSAHRPRGPVRFHRNVERAGIRKVLDDAERCRPTRRSG
jgi:hypothetical protein